MQFRWGTNYDQFTYDINDGEVTIKIQKTNPSYEAGGGALTLKADDAIELANAILKANETVS
jgi:hypothetical protein